MASTPDPVAEASAGELVARLSRDRSTLVHDELRCAQAETTAKAKKLGFGLFGGAGLIGLFGVAALVAAAILSLATAVDGWLAEVIVGAAVLAGKRDVSAATSPSRPKRSRVLRRMSRHGARATDHERFRAERPRRDPP